MVAGLRAGISKCGGWKALSRCKQTSSSIATACVSDWTLNCGLGDKADFTSDRTTECQCGYEMLFAKKSGRRDDQLHTADENPAHMMAEASTDVSETAIAKKV